MKFNYVLIALLLGSASLSINNVSFGAVGANPVRAPEQSQPPPTFANWDAWHGYMSGTPTPGVGCFEAKYPNPVWQKTTCAPPTSGHEAPSRTLATKSTVGNGNDFVAQSPSTLIASAVGTFPSVTGLTSENDVCVGPPPFCTSGGAGANAYSLQVNAIEGFTVTFNGWAGTGWQQFIFDNEPSGWQGVWIEYWLFNYLATHASCPGSVPQNPTDGGPWFTVGSDCVWNTAMEPTPNEPPTSLSLLSLGAYANLGSLDEGQLCVAGGTCYTKSEPATVLNLYQQWLLAEFNVLGFIDGSQAQFNFGTTITLENTLKDQSGNAIAPVAPCPNNGQTGETNNLNLASCSVNSSAGQIDFTESNPNTVTFNTNPTSFLGSSSPGSISACGGSFTNGQSSIGCGSGFSATASLPSSASQWQFDHWEWSGGVSCNSNTANPTSCTVSSSGSLNAVYAAQITFQTNPSTVGSISWGSCSNTGYTNGQTLFDTALPPEFGGTDPACANAPPGYAFSSWTVAGGLSVASSSNPSTTATFTGPGTITATFTQLVYVTATSSTFATSSMTTISSASTTSSFSTIDGSATSTVSQPPLITNTVSTTTTVTGPTTGLSTTTFTSTLSTSFSTSWSTISTGETTVQTGVMTTGMVSSLTTTSTGTALDSTTVGGTVTVFETDTVYVLWTNVIQELHQLADEVLQVLGVGVTATPVGQQVNQVIVTIATPMTSTTSLSSVLSSTVTTSSTSTSAFSTVVRSSGSTVSEPPLITNTLITTTFTSGPVAGTSTTTFTAPLVTSYSTTIASTSSSATTTQTVVTTAGTVSSQTTTSTGTVLSTTTTSGTVVVSETDTFNVLLTTTFQELHQFSDEIFQFLGFQVTATQVGQQVNQVIVTRTSSPAQVTMTVSYSVVGGGSPTAPVFHYLLKGVSKALTLTKTPTKVAVDAGSAWSVTPNPLGDSSSSQRWFSAQALTGTASTTTIGFAFQHQYFLTMKVSGPGTVSPTNGWYNSGVKNTITAKANSGHKFTKWTATGTGSFAGTANPATITMNSAITETATFT